MNRTGFLHFQRIGEISMNGKIDVVLVEPGKPAVMAEIGSDLDSLQRAVGGSIEAAYFYDDPIAIVCNEDGKNIGLPMNRAVKDENGEIMDIIVGKFFICGLGEDDFASIPKELQDKYLEKFRKPEAFMKIGHRVFAVPTETIKPDHPKAATKEER
jgi:hypothetical protein